MRFQSPRTSPNLQDAQSAPLGKMSGHFLHGTGYGGQPWAGDEAISVKLIQKFRPAAGEQDMHSILLATQDGTELRAGGLAKQGLWKMSRIVCNARAQQSCCGVRGDRERLCCPIAFAFFNQQASLAKAG